MAAKWPFRLDEAMRRCIAALLGLLAACGSQTRPELAWPPDQPGHYSVAYEERSLTYTPRGRPSARTLRLALWYPSNDKTGRPASYMGFMRPTVFAHAAPIHPSGDGFPILVFSHGHLGFAESAYFITEHFASHGFVVAAPDHTGDTISSFGDSTTTDDYLFRPQDVSATLDYLYALPHEDPLSGHLGKSVAISGHSRGGYTVFASIGATFISTSTCTNMNPKSDWCSTMDSASAALFAQGFRDRRIQAAIPMAPGDSDLFGPDGPATADVPLVLATASMDKQTPNDVEGDRFWAGLRRAGDVRINFPRGGHHTFAVTCDLFPVIGMNDGCGDGFVDPAEAHRIVDAYALALARRVLFGDPSVGDLLSGARSISTEIEFTQKTEASK